VPVLQGVQQTLNTGDSRTNSGAAQFVVSSSGLLVYAEGGMYQDPPNELVFVDREGHQEPVPGLDRPLVTGQVRFSPDGRFFAFDEKAIAGPLWLYDIERRSYRALSRDGSVGWPRWSPDGTRLVVSWSAAGPLNLWSLPVEGSGAWEWLTEGDAFDQPDGRWLAYVSDESGRKEVYVTSFPDRKRTLVVSTHGGESPAWAPDGKHLLYRVPSDLDYRLVDPRDRDRNPPLMSVR